MSITKVKVLVEYKDANNNIIDTKVVELPLDTNTIAQLEIQHDGTTGIVTHVGGRPKTRQVIRQAAIFFTLGFLIKFTCDTTFPFLWKDAWHHLTALSYVCYLRVIYLCSHGNWSLGAFIAWLTTINAFIDEIFFNPFLIEWNEYVGFASIIIVVIKFKRRWIR